MEGIVLYLQFHVHNAGQALSGHTLYGLHGQAIPVSTILHGLDELALKPGERERFINKINRKRGREG